MEKFTNEAFNEIQNACDAAASPNGKNIIFGVAGQCLEEDKNVSYLWVHNVESGANRQLTYSGNEGRALWMDDHNVVFSDLRDEKDKKQFDNKKPLTVFYALDITGGEARELFRVPVADAQAKRIDRDRWMVYGTFDNSSDQDGNQELYEVYDEYPYHADGRGYVNKKRSRIYIYNMSDGQLVPVTKPLFQANQIMNSRVVPILSRDKRQVYFWGEEVAGQTSRAGDAYAYDIESGKTILLFKNDKYMLMDCVEYGGRVYFRGCDLKDSFYGMDLMSVSPHGGDFRVDLSPDEHLIGIAAMDDCMWLVFRKHGRTEIYTWVPGGRLEFLCSPEYVIEGPLEKAGDCVFYTGRRPLETRQLVRLCGDSSRAVTRISAGLAEKYGLSPSQPVSFVNSDGYTIYGWVLPPHGYQPGKKYPAVLSIHGGPQSAYSSLLYPTMQRYAAEGYFVLFCNPRGSTDYGRVFMDLEGKFGTIDFDDLMAFTDHVVRQYPDIDSHRLGVTGGSYGGYMTNWIIGHTGRFKGAISQRSISNWISMYGCSDLSYFVEWGQMATPWRNIDKLWWHSPLKYADSFSTPTLFLQNGKDFRCPVEQAEQMVTALIERGIPTRMVLFHNASHSVMTPRQQRINDDEVIAWLDKYVK